MNQRVTEKDIPIDGRMYRLKKTDAREACWLFSTLAAKTDQRIMNALGKCTRSEFDEIQTIALRLVFTLDTRDGNTVEVPLISGGAWVDKNLASNPSDVMALTTASIMFNIETFLDQGKPEDQPNN